MQVDAMEHRRITLIAKTHIFKRDTFMEWWQLHGIVLLFNVGLYVKQRKDTGCRCHTLLNGGINTRYTFNRLVH